jgi:ferredoxin-NADP reductase
MDDTVLDDNQFWRRAFFFGQNSIATLGRRKHDLTASPAARIDHGTEPWMKCLFDGGLLDSDPGDKMVVLKNGTVVHEIALHRLGAETLIGRHPTADLQLESHRLGMFHLVVLKAGGRVYVKSLDEDVGLLLNRKKLTGGATLALWDGAQVDLPGYRLEFFLNGVSEPVESEDGALEELEEIPDFFYTPPAPPASPLLANLVDDRSSIGLWSEGTTVLKVVDILDEATDTKTFRFAGEQPLLFSYRPGQFVTFVLSIGGDEVKRSYSMSSSPSRPYLLEVTIKRVPGGLVSNWFCDEVKLGDRLNVKGPHGKFSCFEYPSSKMLFIGAGSGITPIVSMGRWINDTGADVDVKLLASFKSPQDIIFRKELEIWSARNLRFGVGVTLTADLQGTEPWDGFRGRVSTEMLREFVPDIDERHVFLCGPEPFSQSVTEILRDMGFDLSRLHSESFGSGRSAQGSSGRKKTLQLTGPTHQVTFAKSGLTAQTDEQVTLLELAEASGIEIEYSCRIGSCGMCEVKCKGNVKIDKECGIDVRSKDAGFVYACCTWATGDIELQA